MAVYRRRENSFNKGWWQTQQDRFQITDKYPPVPFRERNLSAVLSEVLEKNGMRQDAWMLRLEAEWKELAGADVAAYTRPGSFEQGRLTVYVRHSLWLAELSRYGKNQLLKKLQQRFGADQIRQLFLRLEPDQT